jgi:hypothetical protein
MIFLTTIASRKLRRIKKYVAAQKNLFWEKRLKEKVGKK